ncbi:molybdopterin converting factor subunit 1 [Sporosarcina sp. ANT_H38]|uniref:molybdopterin converting factor subunit 1 n=1 Tax=Sporosarcina sp. ANT_H38 TaxID=2597358 RepID=UPI0011F1D7F8|nr:molybdopterin converting factor subunit 1 [Sporosarcina sp. ANT_H38]KAA0955778.1 molybdopterin converting factor subunit 1 [Sporosarcina sp. ANT_H38]
MIKVNYFARLRELTGKSDETIDQQSMTVRELLDWAETTYPGFGKETVHVAVNEEYALKEDFVHSGDICAFIPPVSGG